MTWLTNCAFCQELCNAWQHNRLIRQLPLYKISPLLSLIFSQLQINNDFTAVDLAKIKSWTPYISRKIPRFGHPDVLSWFSSSILNSRNIDQPYESNLCNIAVLIYSIHCILSTAIIHIIFPIRCSSIGYARRPTCLVEMKFIWRAPLKL